MFAENSGSVPATPPPAPPISVNLLISILLTAPQLCQSEWGAKRLVEVWKTEVGEKDFITEGSYLIWGQVVSEGE